MKIRKWMVCASAILLCVAAALLCYRNAPVFQGEKVKTSDAYALDIRRMNGTDSHLLLLSRGDSLHVHFETSHGRLPLRISEENGAELYSGDGELCTDFDLTVPNDGSYTITVTGKDAAGSIIIGKCGYMYLRFWVSTSSSWVSFVL